MSDVRVVFVTLLGFYRWIASGFVAAMVLVTVVGDLLLSRTPFVRYSLWMTISAHGAKYWLGVVAVMTVTMHLRPYVAAGLSRRAFLTGAGAFLGAAGLALSVLMVVGHLVEQSVVHRGPTYPTLTAGHLGVEFLHELVTVLAYAAAGAAITAGYYRFGGFFGLLLMIPAAVPVVVAGEVLELGPHGATIAKLLPYGPALAVTAVATALVAALGLRELRDTPIRRNTAT
jgi:hypothetical protein